MAAGGGTERRFRCRGIVRRLIAVLAASCLAFLSSCPGTPRASTVAPQPVPPSVSRAVDEADSLAFNAAAPSDVKLAEEGRRDGAKERSDAAKPGLVDGIAADGTDDKRDREKAKAEAGARATSTSAAPASAALSASGRLILAFSGDAHYGSPRASAKERERMLASVSASGAAAFYLAGDVTDFGTRSQWMEAASSLSAGLKGMAFASVLGNHDVNGNGRRWWNEYLNRDPEARNGRFDHRWPGVRVIGIDFTGGAGGWSAETESWLRGRLASADPSELLVVVAHGFFYSSGIDGWRDDAALIERVRPLFASAGVDLVVSGHNHYMELLEADGTAYAVVGAAGAPFDPEPTWMSPRSLWFQRGKRGWLELESDGKGAVIRFRGVDGATLHERRLK